MISARDVVRGPEALQNSVAGIARLQTRLHGDDDVPRVLPAQGQGARDLAEADAALPGLGCLAWRVEVEAHLAGPRRLTGLPQGRPAQPPRAE